MTSDQHADPSRDAALTEAGPLEEPAAEVRSPDTYSAADAARVLGVSERRIRQLVGEGRLPVEDTGGGPLRLPQEAVHRERERRRRANRTAGQGAPEGTPGGAAADTDVEAIVQRTLRSIMPLMLEPAERAEHAAREQLQEERALRLQAEARYADAEVRARLAEERLAAATSSPVESPPVEASPETPPAARRRWWGR